jgi:hypothetical protein
MLKRCSLLLFVVLNASLCFARKYTHSVMPQEKSPRVIEHYIGDHDYHQFGKVVMEQKGNNYSITFPLLLYTNPLSNPYEDDIMPKCSQIIIELDNGKVLKSETKQNTNSCWRYWWHYYGESLHARGGNTSISGELYVYKYQGTLPHSISVNSVNMVPNNRDLYGLCWQTKFEFTPADMLLISKYRIVDAYITRNNVKIYLPIKRKQSARIQHSASDLLY